MKEMEVGGERGWAGGSYLMCRSGVLKETKKFAGVIDLHQSILCGDSCSIRYFLVKLTA